VSIEALQVYRRLHESQVDRLATTRLPTEFGGFTALGYRDRIEGSEHIALVHGDPGTEDVLVRIHSECLTGDVFGSRRCDCGPQLELSMTEITAAGAGVVVYLRGHEGRGIGLLHKLQAYALQDTGSDTVDANVQLGFGEDERDYAAGAQILRDLGITSVRLLTNNPDKTTAIEAYGVKVSERLPLLIAPTEDSLRYLQTKAERMGHDLPGLEDN
jgi:3,4-dihydroxy 2-butanone 4-phosphate synthase/GTP cyclohydrolase II